MRLLIVALFVACAYATPQYVKTAGVKGGYSGRGYHGGDNLVSYYNITGQQHGYGGYARTNLTNTRDYEKGVCYIEVPTASLVRDPTHVPAGNGSRPDLSRIRSCCKGYIKNIHNFRICDPVCTQECINGLCTDPDTCTCFPDHVRNLAGVCVPTCPIGCQNGQCAGGECICKDGYRLDSESKFCVPYCREQCGGVGRGNCTAPNICDCKPGYKSTPEGSCKPSCDRCRDGECVGPNDCRCSPGYSKDHYGDCIPQCASPCTPPSRCIAPNLCDNPSNPITTTTVSPYGQQPGYNPSSQNATRVPYGQQPQYPNYPDSQPSQYPGSQPSQYPGSQPSQYPGSNPQQTYPGYHQINQPANQHSYYPGYPQQNYPGNQQNTYPGSPQYNYPGNPQSNYPGSQNNYPGAPNQYPSNQTAPTGTPQNNQPGSHSPTYPGEQNSSSNQQPYNPNQRPSNYPEGQPIYTHIPSNQPSLYPDSQHGNPDQRPSPTQTSNSSQPGQVPPGVNYPSSQYYPGHHYPEQGPSYPGYQQPPHGRPDMAEPYYPNSGYYPGGQGYPHSQPYQPHYTQFDQQHQYIYPNNQESLCSTPCVNGTCVGRDACACNTGYMPIDGDNSRCQPYCSSCTNGVCVSPYVCLCNPGYFKDFSVKGRTNCVRRIRRSADASQPLNIADLLVFEIPDDYVN